MRAELEKPIFRGSFSFGGGLLKMQNNMAANQKYYFQFDDDN
jgi:hypothetical protein